MKKLAILLILVLLAFTIKPTDITGFFLATASAFMTIVRSVVKEILSLVVKVL